MKSRVAIVKGSDRRDNIRRAMELIREDIVSKINGERVIIKPNCLMPPIPLSCTHVDALRGIMDFLADLSPESVAVAETCRDFEQSIQQLDYILLSEEYGAPLIDPMAEDDWVTIQLLNKEHQEMEARISRTMLDCRCRISAAVAKTHDVVTLTASWKNMMGALASYDKIKMHGCYNHRERTLASDIEIIPQNLVRLAKFIPPHIGVIDGYIGMEGNGPARGNEKYLGIAIASADFVAADAVCAKTMGFEPMEISYLNYGHQLGLGTAALDEMEIMGESIESVASEFVPHKHYPSQIRWREFAPVLPR
jgi:uncharacterized protein (DUF362 family)